MYVGVCHFVRGFQDSDFGRGEEADDNGLPKGEEDDQFDADNFEKWLVFGDVRLELDVELDHEEHGKGHGKSLECQDPNVGKCGR